MSQLQLLNRCEPLALAVNKVLTSCCAFSLHAFLCAVLTLPQCADHACYSNAPEGDELVLLTAPLASTAEVESLFTNGVIDIVSSNALGVLGLR